MNTVNDNDSSAFSNLRPLLSGIGLALVLGLCAYGCQILLNSDLADPLLIALILGIVLRSFIPNNSKIIKGITFAPKIFIPIGIVFYAFKNINFVKYAKLDPRFAILTTLVIITYFVSIVILGKLLKQKKEITYLTATGSGICGASAIAVTSHAMDADSDDVSISLMAVTFIGIMALFVIIPFLGTLFDLSNRSYALLSGTVLQFTGFVKAAMGNIPPLTEEMPLAAATKLAISIKATRYLGLLITIPVFGSIRKNKKYTASIMALFLFSGIAGSLVFKFNNSFYTETITPILSPSYNILWSIAMGAVGLNADIRQLLSNNGLKAMIMALGGFICATIIFFMGFFFIQHLS